MAKNFTRGWKLPLLAGVGITFALMSVLGRSPAPAAEPIAPPPVSQYANEVAGIGVIEPMSETVSIATEISGVVRNVYVKAGDKVAKDDPLFTLDTRDIEAKIKTLEASLATFKIQAEQATTEFNLIDAVKDKRATAQDEINKRKFARDVALARIAETEAAIIEANTTKERLTVKAPIAGQILSINLRTGEFAAAGSQAEPYIRLGDVSTLHVRVEIDEENLAKISTQSSAKGFKRGDATHPINLKFVRFEPYIKPKQNLAVAGQRVDTRVLQAIYAFESTDTSTFVGQQLDVFIAAGK